MNFQCAGVKSARLVYDAQNDIADLSLLSTIVGHVGDVNLHVRIF
jgi:hypothetical protein